MEAANFRSIFATGMRCVSRRKIGHFMKAKNGEAGAGELLRRIPRLGARERSMVQNGHSDFAEREPRKIFLKKSRTRRRKSSRFQLCV
jgi:hypothetical protein